AVEVNPIGIDRLHIPSLTCGHNKVVRKISVKGREICKRRGHREVCSKVIVLIIENYLRRLPRRRNSQSVECCNAAIAQRNLRHARRGREWYSVARHLCL